MGQRRSVKIKTDLHSWEGLNNCSLQDKHSQQLHVNTLLRQEYLDPLMDIKTWSLRGEVLKHDYVYWFL